MKQDRIIGYGLLFPSILIMVALVLYPIILTLIYSLQEYKLTRPDDTRFIGFNNYWAVLKSQAFIDALFNTLIIVGLVLIIGLFFSIVIALILNKKTKISGILTAIAILPWALPPVVNGLLWKFIFYPGLGFFNKILFTLYLVQEPIQWLNTRYGTLVILGIIVSWRVIPFCAIVFLANLQSIPRELYEAARVDGASQMQMFKDITMPLLIPSLAIVLAILTINAINVFDEAVALVGYRTLSETLIIHNYNQTFSFLNIGYGSAITYIIMLGSGIIGYFYIRKIS